MNKLKLRILTLAAISAAVTAPGCKLISEASRAQKDAAEWKQAYEDEKSRSEIAELTASNDKIALQKAMAQMGKVRKEVTRLTAENAALNKQVSDLQRQLTEK